jgi:hypothetical protein
MKLPLKFRFTKQIGWIEIEDEILRDLVKIKALEYGIDLDKCAHYTIYCASINSKGNLTWGISYSKAPI